MICEDAPCCGCCGPAVWAADAAAAEDAQWERDNDPEQWDYDYEDDDVEYHVILVKDDYLLPVAQNNWRVALGWYLSKTGMTRRLPSIGVATCKDGYAAMHDCYMHILYAQEYHGCQTDVPLSESLAGYNY